MVHSLGHAPDVLSVSGTHRAIAASDTCSVMHSTAEGEPIIESARLRERPEHARRTPQPGRMSAEGAPVVEAKHLEDRTGKVHRLLRHRLTSPEKRTVKRVEALRSELFGSSAPPSL